MVAAIDGGLELVCLGNEGIRQMRLASYPGLCTPRAMGVNALFPSMYSFSFFLDGD